MNRPLTVDDVVQAVELVRATYTREEIATRVRPGQMAEVRTLDELALSMLYYYNHPYNSSKNLVEGWPLTTRKFLDRVNKPPTV